MKTILRSILLLSIFCGSPLSVSAEGPGKGRGAGGGKGGGGQEFQEAIHELFANHTKIKRKVEMTETGYRAVTVSDDKAVAATLKKHVREMQTRLGAGAMIRRWDPAFAELVEHYSDIEHELKEVDGGVEMVAKGKTPEAIKVVKNHATIINGFVDKGAAQMHATHPKALTEKNEAKDKAPAEKACPNCKVQEKAPKEPNCKECPASKKPETKARPQQKPEQSPEKSK